MAKQVSKIKKKPNLMLKLDREFSVFIRGRDSKNGYFKCISCGKIKPYDQADCGHYINRRHMSTRFDEMNCNAQCRHCNRFDEGNIQGYRKGLVAKYGEQAVNLLELKRHQSRSYSEFEYLALIKHYKSKNKEHEKQLER